MNTCQIISTKNFGKFQCKLRACGRGDLFFGLYLLSGRKMDICGHDDLQEPVLLLRSKNMVTPVTTRSRAESWELVTCGLGLVTMKCYGLGLEAYGLGLVTLKFCGLVLCDQGTRIFKNGRVHNSAYYSTVLLKIFFFRQ